MSIRAHFAKALRIALVFAVSSYGYAGATGEESLGSEELPVLWGFVSPWGVDLSGTIEQDLTPLELETSLYIDAVLYESHSELVSALSSGLLHLATLPIFTYLIAADRGLVESGLVANHRLPSRHVVAIARNEVDALGGDVSALKFARFDPLSSDGWLSLRIVLSGNGISEISL